MNKLSELSEEQRNALQKRLCVNACPNCGYAGTKLGTDTIFNIPSVRTDNNNVIFGRNTDYMPMIACSCPKCGFTSFFNLKALEII